MVLLDHWTAELVLDIAALKMEFREHIQFLPGSEKFLERLGALGKRRLLTTNAHPKALAVKDGKTGIGRYFDLLVSSHGVGAPKEHCDFWLRIAARHDIDPRDVIVDKARGAGAARDAGGAGLPGLRNDSTQQQREPGRGSAASTGWTAAVIRGVAAGRCERRSRRRRGRFRAAPRHPWVRTRRGLGWLGRTVAARVGAERRWSAARCRQSAASPAAGPPRRARIAAM